MNNKNYIVLILSLLVLIQAISFAVITDHRWEDWYITYRASKNLALGNGFVFNKGERLQTYTSPIGSIIPAGLKYVFMKVSSRDKVTDNWVIWAFRMISCLSLSVAVYLFSKTLMLYHKDYVLAITTVALTGTSILIIDNSINGMESAFMLLFISLLLYAIIIWPRNRFMLLIFSYAGIMYTRPDGFIYAGTILLSFVILHFKADRKQKIWDLLKPVFPALLLYLPWLLGTYFYYGTIIPHTIVAKSGLRDYHLTSLFYQFIRFNTKWQDVYAYPFMPPYFYFGGWGKYHLILIAKVLGTITGLYWINIFGNSVGRACSLAVYILHLYLHILSGQGEMPWYLPNITLLSIMVIVFILSDFKNTITQIPFQRFITLIPIIFAIAFFAFIYYRAAIELKYQQIIIENGNRKVIGEWLKANSQAGESIFLEPLGYIGFYSELKTYDYPGMSSPEVVAARKKLHSESYLDLINYLHPTWLALRPSDNIQADSLASNYNLVRVFNVYKQVDDCPVTFGKPYLYGDAIFDIYKIKKQ